MGNAAAAAPVTPVLAGQAPDSFVKSAGKQAGKAAWSITKYLPKCVVNGFTKLNNALGMVPGYAKLPKLDKGFILFAAALDLYQAGKDTISGFMNEQGNILDKIFSGGLSGAKSFGKAVGVLGVSTWAAYALPVMVGGGFLGLAAGLGGAIVGGMLSRFVLDKLVDTHGHVNKQPTFDPVRSIPTSGEDIVKQIDYTWRNSRPHGPSEWLNVDSNFDPSRL